jgi:hypothetical protein
VISAFGRGTNSPEHPGNDDRVDPTADHEPPVQGPPAPGEGGMGRGTQTQSVLAYLLDREGEGVARERMLAL